MEFGQLLKGQLTIILSFFSVLNFIDISYTNIFYNGIKNCDFLKVGDEKGIFLFLYLINLLVMVLILELLKVSNQSKYRTEQREDIYYIQSCTYNNSILLFVNFISLYIFKALSKKTLDLLLLSLISSSLFNLTFLLGLISVSGYFYVNFVLANVLCFLYTFLTDFDSLVMVFKHAFTGYKFYKQSPFN
ncbi:hypothetical protein NBO_568g0003 [Nosema bombycis CQ1]|uniref:Uncharacterized protein n=1 Tax=Nosema bombycis (strain CQ1 / CVCC 102059) TaxID=578461 RepID=R0KN28_NOSB1|nr:hypothetical protein NBO_568g0003 [Nosema bombycis CQ1]|eukprot:EOB12061.1 hypothetical protein NBO_568g0003 [Nosema bombycis CQ1]